LQIDSVGQKLSTAWGNFSQGVGTPGTHRDIAFLQLAVKELKQRLESTSQHTNNNIIIKSQ
jgi:hypothetical protein